MDNSKKSSVHSMVEATRSVVSFSGHGKALGASGYKASSSHQENCEFLEHPGQSISVSPPKEGFDSILVGVAWDERLVKDGKLLGKLLKKTKKIAVDLDVGCLYELKNGERGALQAFGEKYGHFDRPPFIALSEDERKGTKEGYDEHILINGNRWNDIKRVLLYVYIYDGAPSWSHINPQVLIDVPGENDFYVTLDAYQDGLCLCAFGELENVRGGIKLTNRTEYFHGHEEMDRAFGFGLDWADGSKPPETRK